MAQPLLLHLPPELLAQILSHLSRDSDLGSLALTCRLFRCWLLPNLTSRLAHFHIGEIDVTESSGAAALRLQTQLIAHLANILLCPALRYLTRSALIGFVAFPDLRVYRRQQGVRRGLEVDVDHQIAERGSARKIVAEASRRAGFQDRGLGDEDNLDFLTGLVVLLSPRLEEVKVDYSNLTLCHFLGSVGGLRLVQDALPGDVSTWGRR